MSDARIYVEGGGNTEELRARCREGITKLLKNSGFAGRLPRIVACGSRNEASQDFKTVYLVTFPDVYPLQFSERGK